MQIWELIILSRALRGVRSPVARLIFKNLLDDVFKKMAAALREKRIKRIQRIRGLRDEDDKIIWGRLIRAKRLILIRNNLSREELLKTLIHELIHYVLRSDDEVCVREVEKILWQYFTERQKVALAGYIPKRLPRKRRA